jgi:hypothetical protein
MTEREQRDKFERKNFAEFIKESTGITLQKRSWNTYSDFTINMMWIAWQARAELDSSKMEPTTTASN